MYHEKTSSFSMNNPLITKNVFNFPLRRKRKNTAGCLKVDRSLYVSKTVKKAAWMSIVWFFQFILDKKNYLKKTYDISSIDSRSWFSKFNTLKILWLDSDQDNMFLIWSPHLLRLGIYNGKKFSISYFLTQKVSRSKIQIMGKFKKKYSTGKKNR